MTAAVYSAATTVAVVTMVAVTTMLVTAVIVRTIAAKGQKKRAVKPPSKLLSELLFYCIKGFLRDNVFYFAGIL